MSLSPWGKSYTEMCFGPGSSKDQIEQPEYNEVEEIGMMPPSQYPFCPPVGFTPGYMYGNNMYQNPGFNPYAYPMNA